MQDVKSFGKFVALSIITGANLWDATPGTLKMPTPVAGIDVNQRFISVEAAAEHVATLLLTEYERKQKVA